MQICVVNLFSVTRSEAGGLGLFQPTAVCISNRFYVIIPEIRNIFKGQEVNNFCSSMYAHFEGKMCIYFITKQFSPEAEGPFWGKVPKNEGQKVS